MSLPPYVISKPYGIVMGVKIYTVRNQKNKARLGCIWNAGSRRSLDWRIANDRRERGFLFIDQAARALWMREQGRRSK